MDGSGREQGDRLLGLGISSGLALLACGLSAARRLVGNDVVRMLPRDFQHGGRTRSWRVTELKGWIGCAAHSQRCKRHNIYLQGQAIGRRRKDRPPSAAARQPGAKSFVPHAAVRQCDAEFQCPLPMEGSLASFPDAELRKQRVENILHPDMAGDPP